MIHVVIHSFDTNLSAVVVEGWLEYYVDYKGLKALL
jgi:hypothetical protein